MAWRPSVRTDAFDVALAVVLGGLAWLSLYVGGDPFLTAPELADYSRLWGAACLSVMHVALAVRRRYPLGVAVVVTAAFLPVRFLDIPEFQVAQVSLFVAIYSAGAYGGTRRHAVRGVIAAAIGVLVVWTVLRDPFEPYEGRIPLELLNAFTAVVNVFYVAAAWMLGDLVRTRRQREAQLEAQAVVLEEAHEERARRAVLAERIRIARELHDVVAHHVSVMGVQAGAARRVLDGRPEAVPELLGSIEDASRHAVAELHRLLGFLRSDDEVDGTGPQPSLARLDELVGHMRDAGLSVDLVVDGPVDPVPAGVDLSAFRIVQEALTNTLKHGGPGSHAAVAVARREAALEVIVTDDGAGSAPPAVDGAAANGHGLVGMRERVALHGGELHTGAVGSGFEVRAWFPVSARPAAVEG